MRAGENPVFLGAKALIGEANPDKFGHCDG